MNGDSTPSPSTTRPHHRPYSTPAVHEVAPISVRHATGPTNHSTPTSWPTAYTAAAPGGYCENTTPCQTTSKAPLNAIRSGGAGIASLPEANSPAWNV